MSASRSHRSTALAPATLAPTVGFVSGGRMVRILVGGWKRAGVTVPDLCVFEPNVAALRPLFARLRPSPGR